MPTIGLFDVDASTLDLLGTNLGDLINDFPAILDAYASEGADIIVQIGQQLAHRDTGAMANTWHKERVASGHYRIISDMDYAIYEVNRQGEKGGTPHDFITATIDEFNARHAQPLIDKYLTIMVERIIAGM